MASEAKFPWSPLWTPLTDDGRRGWVSTEAEVKAVKAAFEHATGIKYFIRKGSTGTKIAEVTSEELKSKRVRFREMKVKETIMVEGDGTPFMMMGHAIYCCMYGSDRHGYRKKKQEEELKRLEAEGKLPDKKRPRKYKVSIKQECPGMLHIKVFRFFTEYKIGGIHLNKKWKERIVSSQIREDLEKGKELASETRIYLKFPSDAEHDQAAHEKAQPSEDTLNRRKKRKMGTHKLKLVNLQMIEEAASRIQEHVHMTPVMTCGMLDNLVTGRNLFFKCEHLQKTGSFKVRGALNAVSKLMEVSPDTSDLKVITHSSGNFGQALAYAAQLKGLESFVVMPTNAPLCKVHAVLGYGATVAKCEPTEQSREEVGGILQEEMGAHFFSPSQTFEVIQGQGTIGLELLDQIPDLHAVVVPVGGGGMISGIATAIKNKNKDIKVYAAEPANAADCYRSFQERERIPLPPGPVDTVADGLRVSIGENTWPFIATYVDDVIPVTEEQIKDATRLVWQYMKQFIEPSSGVGLAAVLSEKFAQLPPEIENVAIILCGGNVDLEAVKDWL